MLTARTSIKINDWRGHFCRNFDRLDFRHGGPFPVARFALKNVKENVLKDMNKAGTGRNH